MIHNRPLLNLKEKTLTYRFTVVHVSGKKNRGPDAASRNQSGDGHDDDIPSLNSLFGTVDTDDCADDDAMVAASVAALEAVTPVVRWDKIRESTASDPVLVTLQHHIESGFWHLPVELRPYHKHDKYADSLCVVDGMILLGQRIVIPPPLKANILKALHSAHQGVTAMITRAHDSVFWPNISVDITRVRDQCAHCHKIAKSNPMQAPEDITFPDYPFQKLCCDYLTYHV